MNKHCINGIFWGIISFILVFWFINTEIYQELEHDFLDYRFICRTTHRVNPNIVITAIDDDSVNIIGRWPWPRKIHAGLLKLLSQYPPKVIGFDILFTEPENAPREGDIALEYYTRLLGNVVYAGYLDDTVNKLVYPIYELKHAGLTGFINAPPDKDGVIRKIPLVIKRGKDILPSFSLQALCTYLDINYKDVKINFGKSVSIPKIGNVPIDNNGCMWINYVGDQHVFKEIAFQQALIWEDNPENLKKFSNMLVLVGITATGIGDQGNTPLATNVPLITVHANTLNTILNKDFLFKISNLNNLVLIICVITLVVIINLSFKSIKAILLTLLFAVSYVEINLWLFQRNIWLDMLGPLSGFAIPLLLITVYKYGWEERQKRWIKKIFSHYLSKDVIDILLVKPEKLQLGGELKTATVLYLDLRNFSGYCERQSPEEVVKFLNHTFDWITEIILRNGGMLDKYVGDAIISLFGAPLDMPQKEQVVQAVKTALEIVNKWKESPSCVDIGIGINTGKMLIGNMGSRYIFNYTAIGDEVNVAARIQGLTAEYETNIIITDSVYNIIKEKYNAALLGEVTVKGRKGVVKIYKISI